tara:strand:- start:119 stop:637 length:519 start_codon:yes stop_codon:yes gene_type:complete
MPGKRSPRGSPRRSPKRQTTSPRRSPRGSPKPKRERTSPRAASPQAKRARASPKSAERLVQASHKTQLLVFTNAAHAKNLLSIGGKDRLQKFDNLPRFSAHGQVLLQNIVSRPRETSTNWDARAFNDRQVILALTDEAKGSMIKAERVCALEKQGFNDMKRRMARDRGTHNN